MNSKNCTTEIQWEGPNPPQQSKYVLSVLEFQAAVKTDQQLEHSASICSQLSRISNLIYPVPRYLPLGRRCHASGLAKSEYFTERQTEILKIFATSGYMRDKTTAGFFLAAKEAWNRQEHSP